MGGDEQSEMEGDLRMESASKKLGEVDGCRLSHQYHVHIPMSSAVISKLWEGHTLETPYERLPIVLSCISCLDRDGKRRRRE